MRLIIEVWRYMITINTTTKNGIQHDRMKYRRMDVFESDLHLYYTKCYSVNNKFHILIKKQGIGHQASEESVQIWRFRAAEKEIKTNNMLIM